MFLKYLISLPLLFFSLSNSFNKNNVNNEYVIHNGTIESVKDDYLNLKEYRIYFNQEELITSISSSAFLNCNNLESLMLTTSIENISSSAFNFESIKEIHYTGSKKEFEEKNFPFSSSSKIYEYSYDEGFLNYWDEFIRPNKDSNICLISKSTYYEMLNKLDILDEQDKNFVLNSSDRSGAKIMSSISYLKSYFSITSNKSSDILSQKDTITMIIAITIFGMTTISLFYMLKKKDYIN